MNDQKLLAEYLRRNKISEKILSAAFPKQRAFIVDKSRRKAALCTRRAGKTYGIALMLYLAAFSEPYAKTLYLTLTRQQAKDILWDVLKKLNDDLHLGIHPKQFNETELRIVLPNRSTIKLSGADADNEERNKVLGQPYCLAVIDESAAFRTDLWSLIDTHLSPAMADKLGTIVMIGTPGDFIGPKKRRHMFYAVTTGKGWPEGQEGGAAQWSVHQWSAYDNPHMVDNWTTEVAEIEKYRPKFKLTAEYKMMYLGEWAINEDSLVYKFSESNEVKSVPALTIARVIGIDLGFNDATAFTVAGWADHDKTLYFMHSRKYPGWIISQVVDECRRLMAIYPEARLVIDGADKQAVEEMKRRHGLPLLCTEKKGKFDYIRQMNSDLIQCKILVNEPECEALLDEWTTLIWDDRAITPQELKTCDNHAADSALYAWRYARNFLEEEEIKYDRSPAAEVERRWEQLRIEQLEEERDAT